MLKMKLAYKILKSVGEETAKDNIALNQLKQSVKEHIKDGLRPSGGIAVSSVAGPRSVGSISDNCFVRAAQAMCEKLLNNNATMNSTVHYALDVNFR